jgi:hypothetical protein
MGPVYYQVRTSSGIIFHRHIDQLRKCYLEDSTAEAQEIAD